MQYVIPPIASKKSELVKKGSKLYSIFNFKCPRCHEGDLFETSTFSFQKSFEMHDKCPHCGLDYMPEPGFYYGAMFISYIFTGFFSIGFVAFLHWVLGWSTAGSFAMLLLIFAIYFVWIFRVARAVWININIHYDSRYAKTA